MPGSEVPADLYCHQHIGIVLKPKGFYSHAEEDTWIEFAEWIPDYLQSATQAALRAEMEKYVSDSDEAGYVYAYEIRDPKPLNEFHIKVGRSVNIAERFNSWGKQCGSKETALRGWWPHGIKDGDAANSSSLLTGRINPGEKGKYCHRTERLIHLELRDIALNSTHLTPRFQAIALGERQSKRGKAPVQTGLPSKPCPDCKKMHREIFILQRATSGELKGREWELLVKPIIKKWGNFVTAHASKKA
ncbi:hypothetical protein B0J17DRAFT_568390 [Rhizoctonia solani]|nr:hypothetical protein B0J17DRAFT_568390 [Rhizoctonia solani]